MNSKELVRAAIRFECPERLPLEFPQLGMTDIHPVAWNQIGAGYGKGRTLDEWGCTWERSDVVNFGQVVGHPLADWKALDHFRWPDPDDPVLYEGMEARFEGGEDKFVQTSIFMLLFERMHALHGFQNTLEDLYLERERLEALADRIIEYDIRIIENIAARFPGKVDGFWFTDDWGTEINTFISTALFVDFFQPRYRKIFDACHRAGWLITMHSCGKVNNFIGLLKEAGADCMNLQQPRAWVSSRLASSMRGKSASPRCATSKRRCHSRERNRSRRKPSC